MLAGDVRRICNVVTGPSFGHSDHDTVNFQIIVNYVDSTADLVSDTEGSIVRLWRQANFQALAEHFLYFNWYDIVQSASNAIAMWNAYCNIIEEAITPYVPVALRPCWCLGSTSCVYVAMDSLPKQGSRSV